MSGTSLDGVDLAFCSFDESNNQMNYKVLYTKAVDYSDEWKTTLQQLPSASAKEFVATDHRYGRYVGQLIKVFCDEIGERPDAIASHGHTIFHEPALGYTSQIGNPNEIYAACGVPVIADFRSLDVAFGGTGAPLVPIGDQLLFGGCPCINLGGIANLSYFTEGNVVAFDVSPFNLLFNYIANQNGTAYDKGGELASQGKVDDELLSILEQAPYYKEKLPKSLDKTWVEQHFFPLLDRSKSSLVDKQRTIVTHLVNRLAHEIRGIQHDNSKSILITGGGAHNTFFIEQLKKQVHQELMVPERQLVDFKEALIFAFLGYRKITGRFNVLSNVTGATQNVVSGVVVGYDNMFNN